MRFVARMSVLLLFLIVASGLLALQGRVFRGSGEDDDSESVPVDKNEKAEYIFARFHYNMGNGFRGFNGFQRWAADYPKGDRQFLMGVKHLTRVQAKSTSVVVDADSDDLYNWPWLYVEA